MGGESSGRTRAARRPILAGERAGRIEERDHKATPGGVRGQSTGLERCPQNVVLGARLQLNSERYAAAVRRREVRTRAKSRFVAPVAKKARSNRSSEMLGSPASIFAIRD